MRLRELRPRLVHFFPVTHTHKRLQSWHLLLLLISSAAHEQQQSKKTGGTQMNRTDSRDRTRIRRLSRPAAVRMIALITYRHGDEVDHTEEVRLVTDGKLQHRRHGL